MTLSSRILGTQAWWVRLGDAYTAPSSGTVDILHKPDVTDSSWTTLGVVTDLHVKTGKEEKEIFGPTPGALRRVEIIHTKHKLDIDFTAQQIQALTMESLFRTGPLTSSSTQFSPLSKTQPHGWLKVQQYDQNDNLVNTLDYWGMLVIDDINFNDDVVKATYKFMGIHSTLNTGKLENV